MMISLFLFLINMFNFTYRHSLVGRRFVIFTVLFSSFITLLFTVVQLSAEYNKQLDQRVLFNQIIHDSLLDSLSKSIWTYDDAQIYLQLQGIVNIPTIERAVLDLPENVEFNIGQVTSDNIVIENFQVDYSQAGKNRKMGELIIYSEMDSTYNHLLAFGSVMLFSNLLKTSLVVLFMLYLSDRLIGRHLMNISQKLAKYNEGDKPCPIELQRIHHDENDEIDLLVDSINNMQQRIYFERNKAFNELSQKEDIQEQIVKQKEKLLKLEHKVSLSEIVRSLANELNAPLINIKAFCKLSIEQMQSTTFEPKRLELVVDKIIENSCHALDIVNRTKEIMKRSEPQRIRTNVNELITRGMFLLSQESKHANISIKHHINEQYVGIYADELQVEQVLVNIFRNAIEALCSIEASNKTIEVSAITYNERVIIRIEDNGPGISDLIVDRVFQPFFSTRDKGLGIGLCIAKTLVNSNDGDISIDRNYKLGACFNIEFPLKTQE